MKVGVPTYLLLGQLRRDFILAADGKYLQDNSGGNILYSAGGSSVWLEKGDTLGLVARVGEDYPREWLEELSNRGLDTRGVRVLNSSLDIRRFIAYSDVHTAHLDDPVGHYVKRGLPFPHSLLGYRHRNEEQFDRPGSYAQGLKGADLPEGYRQARAAHLCAMDFQTHSLMPSELRASGVPIVTLDPGDSYMHRDRLPDIVALLPGLTAFLPDLPAAQELFKGQTEDVWEMAEALGKYGCQAIVIKAGAQGQFLFDAASGKRYEVPAYPARLVDMTGAGDAFAGGFLAGLGKTGDLLEATLYGNVAASISVEGLGPFFAAGGLPGLSQARLDSLRELVRKI